MFEYFITNNKKILMPTGTDPKGAVFSKYQYSIGDYKIWCKTLKDEAEFKFEDNRVFVLLLGSVYWYIDYETSRFYISPEEIAELKDLKSHLKDLRGNYQIIIFDKINNKIELINDVLGLLPVYYAYNEDSLYISNSIIEFNILENKLNKTAFYERLIFDHILNDNTFYEGVYQLEQASILEFDNNLKIKQYFNIYAEISEVGTTKFNIQEFVSKFNKIVKSRISYNKTNTIPLTGGHDGRAVLSSVLLNKVDFKTFSFGRLGSENTKIPEDIANEMSFDHNSIYLDNNFTNDYFENAIETILLSGGELPFTQQTALYAFKKLKLDSKKVFTGLLAGEVLGPVHLLTDYVNPHYYRYIYQNIEIDIKKLFQDEYALYAEIPSDNVINEIEQHLIERKQKLREYISMENEHMLSLIDMVTYGFRRFYGSQMHLIRYYAENIPLFYDLDLLKLLIKTDFNKTYKNSFKGRWKRRKSRVLQNSIISLNSPVLAKMKLDRGFTPKQYINPVSKLFIPVNYFIRKRNIKKGNTTKDFLNHEWEKNLLERNELTQFINKSNFVKSSFIDIINYKNGHKINLSGIEKNLLSISLGENFFIKNINR